MGLLKPARQARNCVCAAALAVFPVAVAQTTATASLDADVAAVVQLEHLPGLAMAVVDNGQVALEPAVQADAVVVVADLKLTDLGFLAHAAAPATDRASASPATSAAIDPITEAAT